MLLKDGNASTTHKYEMHHPWFSKMEILVLQELDGNEWHYKIELYGATS